MWAEEGLGAVLRWLGVIVVPRRLNRGFGVIVVPRRLNRGFGGIDSVRG